MKARVSEKLNKTANAIIFDRYAKPEGLTSLTQGTEAHTLPGTSMEVEPLSPSLITLTYRNTDGVNHRIRIDVQNSFSPWFVAQDVCKALGCKSPHHKITRKLQEGDKKYSKVTDSHGRWQQTSMISYMAIGELVDYYAHPFNLWVMEAVAEKCAEYLRPQGTEDQFRGKHFRLCKWLVRIETLVSKQRKPR